VRAGRNLACVVTQLLGAGRLARARRLSQPLSLGKRLQPFAAADLPAAYSPGRMPLAQAIACVERLDWRRRTSKGGFTD